MLAVVKGQSFGGQRSTDRAAPKFRRGSKVNGSRVKGQECGYSRQFSIRRRCRFSSVAACPLARVIWAKRGSKVNSRLPLGLRFAGMIGICTRAAGAPSSPAPARRQRLEHQMHRTQCPYMARVSSRTQGANIKATTDDLGLSDSVVCPQELSFLADPRRQGPHMTKTPRQARYVQDWSGGRLESKGQQAGVKGQ